jgi:uracil-DNA glycosylase
VRTLLLGQAPSRESDPDVPLGGRSGAALAALAGLADLRDAFDVENLLPEWPGKNGKGDRFPIVEARMRLLDLVARERDRERVICVGKNVARAVLPRSRQECFRWYDSPLFWPRIAVVPHPSGINLVWNDPNARERASKFLRAAAAESIREAR